MLKGEIMDKILKRSNYIDNRQADIRLRRLLIGSKFNEIEDKSLAKAMIWG